MSFEAAVIALQHSQAKGATLLVLLAIANHDGDGGAWPSIATLMRYARASEMTVHRAITQLEALGEIRRVVQGGGTPDAEHWQRPNRYDFLLSCPAGCDRSKNHRVRPVVEADDALIEVIHNRVSLVIPGITSDTPPGTTGDTQTNPLNPVEIKSATHVTRKRVKARCGHDLIDDRHCTHGCPISESMPA